MTNFERLIDRIYEAAGEPEAWPSVLHDIGKAVDAQGGMFVTKRADNWLGMRLSGAMVQNADSYMAANGPARSLTTERLLRFDRAGFVADQEIFTDVEFATDAMVAEWLRPAGLYHGAATAIHVPTGDLVVVQINRRLGRPPMDATSLSLLDAFRPHLARAGMLAARWRLERLRVVTEALALLGLPAAVLSADGRVLAANALIEELRSHVVWLPGDKLALCDATATALLDKAMAGLKTPGENHVLSFPARGRAEAGAAVVHLVPTTGYAREVFEGSFGVMVITPVTGPAPANLGLLQGLFDLTPAEARVASSIGRGLNVEEIAAGHQVSTETVRSQVKAVPAKTGARRQSEVAALLACVPRFPVDIG